MTGRWMLARPSTTSQMYRPASDADLRKNDVPRAASRLRRCAETSGMLFFCVAQNVAPVPTAGVFTEGRGAGELEPTCGWSTAGGARRDGLNDCHRAGPARQAHRATRPLCLSACPGRSRSRSA
jgi:hypothetical protein